MASVTRATRRGVAASMLIAAITGLWWTPSQISSTITRWSASRTGTGPGSRWWIERIAENRWVATVAPHSMDSAVWMSSASECPNATATPASVKRRVAASACSSSTARVIIRSAGPPAAMSRSTEAGSGTRRSASSWAPFFASGARNGALEVDAVREIARVRRRPRSTASCASSFSIGSVTVEAKIVVVPCVRWYAMALEVAGRRPGRRS